MMEERDLSLASLWNLVKEVQMRWLVQKVTEYREWLRDPFRWEYEENAEEGLDAFISWLEDD